MTWKRHDAEMPSCCQDLKQLWLEGHGHWTCVAGLKAAWQMTTVGLSAACQLSNENIVLKVIFESFPQVSIRKVWESHDSAAFFVSWLFLSNCVTSFWLIVKCAISYWYSSVMCCILLLNIWICSLKHYLMKYCMTALQYLQISQLIKVVIVTEYFTFSYAATLDRIQQQIC